jgi:hypothetical protein
VWGGGNSDSDSDSDSSSGSSDSDSDSSGSGNGSGGGGGGRRISRGDATPAPGPTRKIKSRITPKTRPTKHPPPPGGITKTRTKEQKARWVVACSDMRRFTSLRNYDCGCELYSQGCYMSVASCTSVEQLASIATSPFNSEVESNRNTKKTKKHEFYQRQRDMLEAKAEQQDDGAFVMKYSLCSAGVGVSKEVCRDAYCWFTSQRSTTLAHAEDDFKSGKRTWGHAQRKPRRSTQNDRKVEDCRRFISEFVTCMSEEQPNGSVLIEIGDEDDRPNLQLTTKETTLADGTTALTKEVALADDDDDDPSPGPVYGKNPGFQYGINKTSWKAVAQRHMDPVVIKELHREYVNDQVIFGTAQCAILQKSRFHTLFREILKELKVYVRKNKGVSGDCKKCTQCNSDLLRQNVTPAERQKFKDNSMGHIKAVRFIRGNKQKKMIRGAMCAR